MAEPEMGIDSPLQTGPKRPSTHGDRRLPDGPRKLTACVACRKLKASPIIEEENAGDLTPNRSNVICPGHPHRALGASAVVWRVP